MGWFSKCLVKLAAVLWYVAIILMKQHYCFIIILYARRHTCKYCVVFGCLDALEPRCFSRKYFNSTHPPNDLDDDITSKVLKFADDTKVFREIKSDADRQHFQDDLNKLIEWSEK